MKQNGEDNSTPRRELKNQMYCNTRNIGRTALSPVTSEEGRDVHLYRELFWVRLRDGSVGKVSVNARRVRILPRCVWKACVALGC